MKTLILSITFVLILVGCRPEQEPTEWNITVAPQAGLDGQYQTNMNEPLEFSYKIEDSAESVSLTLVLVDPPLNGRLTNCIQTSLSYSCIYHPNQNFIGEDKLVFTTRDGDFKSDDFSTLKIIVNPVVSNTPIPPPIVVPDPEPPVDPPVEDVVYSCEQAATNGSLLTQTYTIDFPAAIECDFNENGQDVLSLNAAGNGPRQNLRIRARIEQNNKIALPSEGTICDLDFNFPNQAMQYDDEIILTVNNYVVMASTDYSTSSGSSLYAAGLKVNEHGLVQYNWFGTNSLYNLYYAHAVTPKYCLGLTSSDPGYNEMCNIPSTEQLGQIKLDIPAKEIIKLGISDDQGSVSPQTEIDFGFITTGDDDNGDCEHSAYGFQVTVKYMESEVSIYAPNSSLALTN
jgi:hypothetical protein